MGFKVSGLWGLGLQGFWGLQGVKALFWGVGLQGLRFKVWGLRGWSFKQKSFWALLLSAEELISDPVAG